MRCAAKRIPALERAVAEAMTINETSFFRDSRPFELLAHDLLPQADRSAADGADPALLERGLFHRTGSLSLAMLLREHFPWLAHWNLRIEGTDICEDAVRRAQAAGYHRIEMNRGLPARCLVRYFEQAGEEWEASRRFGRMCHFQQANLCNIPFPFHGTFDVIFLRNVMLYFAAECRRAVLAEMHRLLAPDGVLFLGTSEQPADRRCGSAMLSGGTCYFKPR